MNATIAVLILKSVSLVISVINLMLNLSIHFKLNKIQKGMK